ncbi:hypothetical protein [Dactylosporangium sp. CA-139066]|uniref:hypothetical protein n=1 Tax=Dactylosporangium sp. CA-139066 TaxID=3239930 RepID=UPI003D8B22ED
MDERDYRSTRVYQLSRRFLTRPGAPVLDDGWEVPRSDDRDRPVNDPTFNQHLSPH